MTKLLAFAICVLLVVPAETRAADFKKNEWWIGGGVAGASEKNIFNIPNDVASVPEGMASFGYFRNLGARHALGFQFYGTFETTPVFPYQGASGIQPTEFDLDTYNAGLRYRYAFARRAIVPYVFVGAGGSWATLSSSGRQDLDASGLSACAGPGIGLRLGQHFMLSAEGIASFGTAKWSEPPAANSTGTKYDPSHYGGLINLSVLWGVDRPKPPAPLPPAVADSGLTALAAPPTGPTAGQIVLEEACILALSSAATVGDEGVLLASVTAVAAVLGTAAGNSPDPTGKPTKIMFFGLLSLAALELTAGKLGASDEALFGMSFVGWNLLGIWATSAERAHAAKQ